MTAQDSKDECVSASVRFLYLYCNDLATVRHFYTTLLQLEESFFAEGKALAYRCDRLQFTVFQADRTLPVIEDWARQPGWEGGKQPHISWSVEYGKKAFKRVCARLKEAGVASFHDNPMWVGYWSYPVRDPMGHTVELTCPTDEPNDPSVDG